MAEAVQRSIATGEHLAVQAGTGTGKSLAYLVPAAEYAVATGSCVVVATATIALQRQLIDRDLPRLAGALEPLLGREPTFAILKGRRNYLCRYRLDGGAPEEPGDTLFDPAATSRVGQQVRRLHEWAAGTETGDRDELVPGVDERAWRQVSVSARECVGAQRCTHGHHCFAERAREEAGQVDIVVTNHALLAIDALEDFPLLPDHQVVVVDEAHDLVSRVTSVASKELSGPGAEAAARRSARLLSGDALDRLREAAEAVGRMLAEVREGRIDVLDEPLAACLASVRAAAATCGAEVRTGGKENADDAERLALGRIALAALDDVRETADRILGAFDAEIAARPDVVWMDRPAGEDSRRPPTLRVAPLDVGGLLAERVFRRRTVVLTSATLALGGSFEPLARQWGLPPPGTSAARGGAAGDSKTGDSAARNGTAEDTAARNGTAEDTVARDGTGGDSGARERAAGGGKTAGGAARDTAARNTAARSGAAGDTEAGDGAARSGTPGDTAARDGVAESGTAGAIAGRDGAAGDRAAADGETRVGAAGSGMAEDTAVNDGAAGDTAVGDRKAVGSAAGSDTAGDTAARDRAARSRMAGGGTAGGGTARSGKGGGLAWSGRDVGSPFDHPRSGILYVARHLPPPGRDGLPPSYLTELSELIDAAGGRTLGLFSSMRAARQAADTLREVVSQPLLCQGDDATAQLVKQFAEDEATCLFGTLSLWQGVDVPGAALQLVVIDRIPFPRPDDPLASARQRAVAARGGNGFMTVAAAHAALLLAQGAGRLLRTMEDRGMVAILDPRLATARYAGFLRASLPPFWATTDPAVARGALRRLAASRG
jgi:ATP-dependent DNA helicase DinG